MASEKQESANRANAQKSTGPKTDEGKDRSRFNAIKHGIYAREMIIPGERKEDFDALLEGFFCSCQPNDAIEQALVRQMASAEWRLQRLDRAQAGMLTFRNHRAMEQLSGTDLWEYNKPDTAEGRDFYFNGRALSHISACGFGQINAIARFENAIRKSFMEAMQGFEGRRRLPRETKPNSSNKTNKVASYQVVTKGVAMATEATQPPLPGAGAANPAVKPTGPPNFTQNQGGKEAA